MSLRCPNCHERIDPATLACPNGHRYACWDGVVILLADEFSRQLQAFTTRLRVIRSAERKPLMDASAYEELPFSQTRMSDPGWRLEWRLRSYDLAIALGLLRGRESLRVLDIGAWNGWLSHRLALSGHDATAIDYFADEYDGLGARKFYRTRWQAIQMDLADLSVLEARYDVVILNRCLQFFTDPIAYVVEAKQRVAPGGMLILTGLQFFQDARAKARRVADSQQLYRDRYDFELFLRPAKGYLDFSDKARLQAQGVEWKPYPQLWLANLRSMIDKTLPSHYYGVCRLECGG